MESRDRFPVLPVGRKDTAAIHRRSGHPEMKSARRNGGVRVECAAEGTVRFYVLGTLE